VTAQKALPPEALERLWAEHLAGEFENKDVEATLATMVEDAFVDHVPVHTGGRGKAELRAFYRDDFIPSWPEDLKMTPVNRVVGAGKLVDELHLSFTHSRPRPWLLPKQSATHRKLELDLVVVVEFRGDKLAAERIYWDHASVLRQAGLLTLSDLDPESVRPRYQALLEKGKAFVRGLLEPGRSIEETTKLLERLAQLRAHGTISEVEFERLEREAFSL